MSGERRYSSGRIEGSEAYQFRVQQSMKRAAEDVYWGTVIDLENESQALARAIESEADVNRFKMTLNCWMVLYNEMTIAEREWHRCTMDPQERCELEQLFIDTQSKFRDVKDRACHRLDVLIASLREGEQEEEYFTEQGNPSARGSDEASFWRERAQRFESELQAARRQGNMNNHSNNPLPEHLLPPLTFSRPQPVDNSVVDAHDRMYHQSCFQPEAAPSVRSESNPMQCSPVNYNAETVLDKLTDALSNLSKKEHLPRTEPDIFKGDIFQFPTWWNSFSMLIDRVATNPYDKLVYLGKYTAGEARDSIKGFLTLLDDPTAYDKAKERLRRRYGDRVKMSEAYRQRLRNWPQLKRGDPVGLRRFSDFLWQCEAAMGTVGFMNSLDQPEENVTMAKKLPYHLAERWNRLIVERTSSDSASDADYPRFGEFCRFVDKKARIADGPCNPKYGERSESTDSRPKTNWRERRQTTSLNTSARSSSTEGQVGQKFEYKCNFCEGKHSLDRCSEFLRQNYDKKREFVFQHSLCFGCLRRGHGVKTCRRRNDDLMKRPEAQKANDSSEKQNTGSLKESVSNRVVAEEGSRIYCSMVVPVTLSHESDSNKKVVTYALLDSQSDSCFVRQDLLDSFGSTFPRTELSLTTMGSKNVIACSMAEGLVVRGLTECENLKLPVCYSRGEIPASPGCIPDPAKVAKWPHLHNVSGSLVPYREDWGIGLLIGYNCARALLPLEVASGENATDPYGIRTPLGWSVIGQVDHGKTTEGALYCFSTSAQEVTVAQVRAAFDVGFEDKDRPDEKRSQEDLQFMQTMKEGVRQLESGHIELPLPLRDSKAAIPESRKMAERRLGSLRNKLLKNLDFRKKYIAFIQKMRDNDYIEKVPTTEGQTKKWYLPHQGVQHPRKPDVVRVVHDGSAECQGVSLNSMLLPGPDQNNLLAGVLMRFRLGKYCFTCDIEGMFLQVVVSEEFRDMLRFLWFLDDDPTKEIVEYRVKVHLFGATSSPACATYALREVARRYGSEFDEAVTDFIERYFYVDDGLRATHSREEALRLIFQSRQLCLKGGFNLHKYMSNDVEILKKIPEEYRAKDITPEYLTSPDSPPYSLLGTEWNLYDDSFKYKVVVPEKCETKRAMLTFLGSIYDPRGLVSPIVLKGRKILQSLCKTGVSWDRKADEEHLLQWNLWMSEMKQSHKIKVPRCCNLDSYPIAEGMVHIFSDASSTGYGICAYLELRGVEGGKVFNLIYAKSRVNPLKAVTIPRMELQAAVLAVNSRDMIMRELLPMKTKFRFYTDSKVVLGYIQNSKKKYRLYVANRVQTIRERSQVSDWSYVNTRRNPADLTSRGVSPEELMESSLWWHGPDEVMSEEKDAEFFEVSESDPELARESVAFDTSVRGHFYLDGLAAISSWEKIVKVCAVWRRFMFCVLAKIKGISKPVYTKHVSCKEKDEALKCLIVKVQQCVLAEEYKSLMGLKYPEGRQEHLARDVRMGDTRRLRKLDPYVDEEGILRVGGRIRRANLPLGWKHPAILPSNHAVTSALIRYYHTLVGHGGKDSVITEIRNAGFWILRCRKVVGSVLGKCVVCKKVKSKTATQKMSDLPRDRLEVAPPFTFIGADMFGPFYIKEGRSKKKRWVCLFTCLVLRAVHLEICEDLSTSSFINAFRRLVARRGPVKSLRSDQGTNILGARAELSLGLNALDSDVISVKLAESGCDYIKFIPNPPHAPHMGGVWERLVKSVKQTLSLMLAQVGDQLSQESLFTFLLEAEAIVNNRPITTADYTDPEAPQPLSPIQLLTLKPRGPLPPPGKFVKEDMYSRGRWKRVQYLANEFWSRWKKEYLPLLQARSKWEKEQPNLKEGDIVLDKKLHTPRSQWPLARIVSAKVSEDGLVRSVKIKTQDSEYDRPIHQLIPLIRNEEQQPSLADGQTSGEVSTTG